MSKTLYKLKALYAYYSSTRGRGHTEAMIEGAARSEPAILVHRHRFADYIRHRVPGSTFISYSSLDHGLRGQVKPLLVDNGAMMDILQDAIQTIEGLERELDKARRGQ